MPLNKRIFAKPNSFSKAQLDKLFKYIRLDDIASDDLSLPENPSPILTEEMICDGWTVAQALLFSDFNPSKFRKLVWHIAVFGPDESNQLLFKDTRSKFKYLRFACANFSVTHHCPTLFHLLTYSMGEVQDAYKNHNAPRRFIFGLFLWFLLNPLLASLLKKQMSSIVPVTPQELLDFQAKENKLLEKVTFGGDPTGAEFHKIRKIANRRVAGYNMVRTLYPHKQLDSLATMLSTINGLMGDYHDVLIEKKLKGTQNYNKDRFQWPEESKSLMKDFLKQVESVPPKEL